MEVFRLIITYIETIYIHSTFILHIKTENIQIKIAKIAKIVHRSIKSFFKIYTSFVSISDTCIKIIYIINISVISTCTVKRSKMHLQLFKLWKFDIMILKSQ